METGPDEPPLAPDARGGGGGGGGGGDPYPPAPPGAYAGGFASGTGARYRAVAGGRAGVPPARATPRAAAKRGGPGVTTKRAALLTQLRGGGGTAAGRVALAKERYGVMTDGEAMRRKGHFQRRKGYGGAHVPGEMAGRA